MNLRNEIRKKGVEVVVVIPEPPEYEFSAPIFHVYGTASAVKLKASIDIWFSLDRILERIENTSKKIDADCDANGPARLSIDAIVAVPMDRISRVDVLREKLIGKPVLDVWNDAVYIVPEYKSRLLDEVLNESRIEIPEFDLGKIEIDMNREEVRKIGGSVGSPVGEDEHKVYESMKRMFPNMHVAVESLIIEHVKTGIVLEFENIGIATSDEKYVFRYGELSKIVLPFRIVSGDIFYTDIPSPWTSHWTQCRYNNKLRMFRTVVEVPY